jgi:hypothetical protein
MRTDCGLVGPARLKAPCGTYHDFTNLESWNSLRSVKSQGKVWLKATMKRAGSHKRDSRFAEQPILVPTRRESYVQIDLLKA